MKKITINTILILFISIHVFSQNPKLIFQTDTNIPFDDYISGVKYADISLNADLQVQVDNKTGIAPFFYLAQKYLQQIGFEYIALTSDEKSHLETSVESYCQATSVAFGGNIDKKSMSDLTISFITCNGDVYSFKSDKKFSYNRFSDIEKKLTDEWKSMVNVKTYNSSNQLKLPSSPTKWNRKKVTDYLSVSTELKPIEGIYERVRLSMEDLSGGKYLIGIVKDQSDKFLIVYLTGATNKKDWKEGELKGKIIKTATPGLYSVEWITRDKTNYSDVYCIIDETGLTFFSSGLLTFSYKFIKLLPVKD